MAKDTQPLDADAVRRFERLWLDQGLNLNQFAARVAATAHGPHATSQQGETQAQMLRRVVSLKKITRPKCKLVADTLGKTLDELDSYLFGESVSTEPAASRHDLHELTTSWLRRFNSNQEMRNWLSKVEAFRRAWKSEDRAFIYYFLYEEDHPPGLEPERHWDALHPHGSRRNGNHQNAGHPAGTSNLIQLTILRARTIALIAVLLSGAPAPFP
jgi:hypothetical protein